jgi:stage II sporulation protein AB (anti-sigma F factor)
MKLEFLSRSSNESFARVVVAAFASQLDPTIEELSDIKTAVSEAVTNAIIHGYEYNEGIVIIESIIEENKVEIIVRDNGKGIEDINKAMEPFYTSKPELERSGMGFTVMETFMDELSVESHMGSGTIVRMSKAFKSVSAKE